MDYRDRNFRNEPDRIEVERDAEPLHRSGQEPGFLPESNSARAQLANQVRASRAQDGAGRVQSGAEARLAQAMSGGGQTLDQRAHSAAAQAGFGDLSGVRVHTDSAAAEAASALGAKAVTVGNDIFFNQGRFAPGTPEGDQLLGHELAHAAQQRGQDAQAQTKLELSTPGDAHEVEADRAGDVFSQAAAGQMVEAAKITSTGLGMARDTETQPAAATTEEPVLTREELADAVRFNQDRDLTAEAWTQIGGVVGSSSTVADADMALAVARFQKAQNFPVDGKVGNFTLQRISQSPGGQGLENQVQNDAVLFLGLNPSSRGVETQTLRNSAGSRNVTSITGARQQDHATVGGQQVNLQEEGNLQSFAAELSLLDPARQQRVIDFINQIGWKGLDETAMLIRVLYEAEFGQRLIKRVVLSGHSGGWSFWGDDNGSLDFAHMANLGAIFPNAVGQVEDLMLSACNTGFHENIPQYLAIFPNLKSIWAYVGYSPSAATGSTRHIQNWERSTRGAMSHDAVNRGRERVSAGSGIRDDNVAVWTRDSAGAEAQYETDSPYLNSDYDSLRAAVDTGMSHYTAAYQDGNINQDALNELYVQMQTLVGNYGAQLGDERETYALRMKHILYLRHWATICRHFWTEHGSKVREAYQSAGASDVPPYGTADRATTLANIAAYPGDRSHEGYVLLKAILGDMDPNHVPDSWV